MVVLVGDSESHRTISQEFLRRCTQLFTTRRISQSEGDYFQERIEQAFVLQKQTEQHEAITGQEGDPVEIEPLEKPDLSYANPLPVIWSSIDVDGIPGSAVVEGRPGILEYLTHKNNLDQLVVCSVTSLEGFTHMVVRNYHTDTMVLENIFDRITLPQDSDSMLPLALLALATEFKGMEVGAVSLQGMLPGKKTYIDDDPTPVTNDPIFLSIGTHRIHVEAYGYENLDIQVEIESDVLKQLPLSMVKEETPPMLITSPFGNTRITLSTQSPVDVPFKWEHQQIPLIYHAEKTGFLPIANQMDTQSEELVLEFSPAWMTTGLTLNRPKDLLYGSLGRSILMVGMTFLMETLAQSIGGSSGNDVAWQPVVLFSQAATGVSLVDTILRLFAYYEKTQYSSR
ncbi:MAG: hypothetical protein AB9828_09815 [Sphaerochaetaceae bacterium]